MSSILLNEILDRSTKLTVMGGTPSLYTYLLKETLVKSQTNFVLICADAETAQLFYQDLKTFFVLSNNSDFLKKIDFFPGWEHLPYLSFTPSLKTRIRRIRACHRIHNKLLRCLITDIVSVNQKIPASHWIESRTFPLKKNELYLREEIITKLESAGYSKQDPVEDVGTYIFRGHLLDVFSPLEPKPFRVEFFGDEIESIRMYNPLSQKTLPTTEQIRLDEIIIIPVTEYPFDSACIAAAKQNIKAFCDQFDISKKHRDSFFERLDFRIQDPELEYLAPFFTNQDGVSILTEQDVILYDSSSIENTYNQFLEKTKSSFQKAIQAGKIVAPVEKLYENELSIASLKESAQLTFEKIVMGTETDLSGARKLKINLSLDLPSDLQQPTNSQNAALNQFIEKIKTWEKAGLTRVVVASTPSQASRINFLLNQKKIACKTCESFQIDEKKLTQIVTGLLSSGFYFSEQNLVFITDFEVFGSKKIKSRASFSESSKDSNFNAFVSSLDDLNPNDLIVHRQHGIGIYRNLVKLEIDQIHHDFLLIEYAGGDKLYIPIYRLDQVQRYVGSPTSVSLDKLGNKNFEKIKEKIKSELKELAHELLQIYAKRAIREGHSYSPPDETYRAFEAKFPYVETPDQLKAIQQVEQDMQSSHIMDRLICGDVGYGKTEVAMRTALRAVLDKKQVAVLVPTTVLALQHEQAFRERFQDIAITIHVLSRFKSSKEIRETLQSMKDGKTDIVIGTHRLLSQDVAFKDLGLLVIDEEHRFGVEHKEKLKKLKINADVLTLTATPIPRTLNMSFAGLRDISIINTPPIDRLSIRTYLVRFNEEIIRSAIQKETARGGQVFYIYNRVQSIHEMAENLKNIVPEAKILVAHGQLEERDLESRMLDFYNKKADILLCSTIIESGLDIPNANTIFIHRADTFGLAQLYQLRGRVGRSQARAFCYLLLQPEGEITQEAKNRLEVIQRFVELGSGFKIASHDLELRGAGNLLGKAQSGQIASVGYELYMELLEQAIAELKNQPQKELFEPEINLPAPALLTENYVPDIHQRLSFYKRLSQASDLDTLTDLENELKDRYGQLPQEAKNLFWLIRLKQLLSQYHIQTLVAGKNRTALESNQEIKLSPKKMLALFSKQPSLYSFISGSKILIKKPFQSVEQLFNDLNQLFSQVAEDEPPC